jgi:hypothetical protein
MKVTNRKYLDQYSAAIGNQISSLVAKVDFSEDNGGFDYSTKLQQFILLT